MERILVVTVQEQVDEIRRQVPEIPVDNYLIEPAARGTASVVGLAATVVSERDPEAVLAVLPSDHFIRDRDQFAYVLGEGLELARRGYLVTLGIAPLAPSTAYGYIQQGGPLEENLKYPAYHVVRFIEKPDEQTAQALLESGDHSWNSGMFIWRADAILGEIRRQMPDLYKCLQQIAGAWSTADREDTLRAVWPELAAETIDYGIMEHARRVVVVPAGGLGWSDVGAWDTLFEVLLPDSRGNIVVGAGHLAAETHNTLVYGTTEGRLIVTIGIDDTVIVDTEDVLLVCKADQAQKVREMVERLRQQNHERYL
jgi:mannose-1-phosphate guanylyltransferase